MKWPQSSSTHTFEKTHLTGGYCDDYKCIKCGILLVEWENNVKCDHSYAKELIRGKDSVGFEIIGDYTCEQYIMITAIE